MHGACKSKKKGVVFVLTYFVIKAIIKEVIEVAKAKHANARRTNAIVSNPIAAIKSIIPVTAILAPKNEMAYLRRFFLWGGVPSRNWIDFAQLLKAKKRATQANAANGMNIKPDHRNNENTMPRAMSSVLNKT